MTRHVSLYLLLSVVLSGLVSPLMAQSAEAAQTLRPITSERSFGCRSEEFLNELVGYAVGKDLDAFKKGLSTGLRLGECTLFEKGEEVVVLETKTFAEPTTYSGLAKVRRQGEVDEYWIDLEAVERPKPEAPRESEVPEEEPTADAPPQPSEPPPEGCRR